MASYWIVNFVAWVVFIAGMTVVSRRAARVHAELLQELQRQRHIAQSCTDMLESVGVDVTVTRTEGEGVRVRGMVRRNPPSIRGVDPTRIPMRFRGFQ
jgi:hypothetical protein